MELSEVRKRKKQAEERIYALLMREISMLNEETGLVVTGVDVSILTHTTSVSGERKVSGSMVAGVTFTMPV